MSWLRPFLLSLFTENIKSKFMALTLAIVLFATVQETLTGSRKLQKLTLVFRLAENQRDKWVILENRIVIEHLTIKGLRSVVDAVVTERERASEVEITVDEDFLARHRPPTIRLDADFLRSENLPGARLETIELAQAPPRLLLTPYASVRYTLAVAPDSESRLQLSPTGPFEGTGSDKQKLRATFSIPGVVVRAPVSAFSGPTDSLRTLLVRLGDIESQLRGEPMEETRATVRLPVLDVDWDASGINGKLLRHVRIIDPEEMAPDAFVNRVEVLVEVQPRFESRDFSVEIVYKRKGLEIDLAGDYTYQGMEGFTSLDEEDLQSGRCTRLALRFAQSFDIERLQEKLQLVIDLTGVVPGADPIRAPVYLDVSDPGLRPNLRLITLQPAADQKQPVAIFNKKSR